MFTDALAAPDFVPLDGDRRGWWGDYFSDTPLGSRLWQLDRSKVGDVKQLLAQARDYCIEALTWLITAGIAASLNVTTSMLQQNGTDVLGIGITITEPTGSVAGFQYQWAWNIT